jgi:hypothetical protein
LPAYGGTLTIVCATDVARIEGLCCSARHVLRSSRSRNRGISRAIKLSTVGTHERSTPKHVVGTWARPHTARLNLVRELVVRTDTTLEVLGTFRLSRWTVCACKTGILGSYSAFHIKLKIESHLLTAQVGAIPESFASEFVAAAVTVQEMEAIVKSFIVSRTGVMVIDHAGMRPNML